MIIVRNSQAARAPMKTRSEITGGTDMRTNRIENTHYEAAKYTNTRDNFVQGPVNRAAAPAALKMRQRRGSLSWLTEGHAIQTALRSARRAGNPVPWNQPGASSDLTKPPGSFSGDGKKSGPGKQNRKSPFRADYPKAIDAVPPEYSADSRAGTRQRFCFPHPEDFQPRVQ